MAYLWKKYEFESEDQADSKISALPHDTDEDGNTTPTHEHVLVKLGALKKTKYSVDALWKDLDESPYGWKSYEITVKGNGVHTFSNHEYKN
jgi:hypothetical protein